MFEADVSREQVGAGAVDEGGQDVESAVDIFDGQDVFPDLFPFVLEQLGAHWAINALLWENP